MSVSFEVDPNLASVPSRVKLVSASDAIVARARVRPEACTLGSVISSNLHPLLLAVRTAYDEHRPLVFTPDAVWLTIVQGFAFHVQANAEALRERLGIRHQGQEDLDVIRDHFVRGSPDNDWPGVFAEFSEKIQSRIGKRHALIVGAFSTTGDLEKAASEIVLIDALKSYFRYVVHTRCGFPRITLEGTADDWRSIHERAAALGEFDLSDWTSSLRHVTEQFVRAAEGHVDRDFWRRCYNMGGGSGTLSASGWVNAFFPYIVEASGAVVPNPRARSIGAGGLSTGSTDLDRFPSGLSSCPFIWKYLGQELPMKFVGGLVGATIDPDGAVRPTVGWGVCDANAPVDPSAAPTEYLRPEDQVYDDELKWMMEELPPAEIDRRLEEKYPGYLAEREARRAKVAEMIRRAREPRPKKKS